MIKTLFISCWNCMLFMYATSQVPLAGSIASTQPVNPTPTQSNRIATVSPATGRIAVGSLIWPLRLASGINDNGYYSLTAFIDHDAASDASSTTNAHTKDYNCGARSWDIDGWNHDGTDITLWPFPWTKMINNEVEVIAAASGIIRKKVSSNDDKSCVVDNCTGCEWNGIIIEHADGTAARYIHLKKNSLTSKAEGQTVAAGEFLGIVGSSGRTHRPHLHFDLWETYDAAVNQDGKKLIDPWAGPCNGSTSLWAAQPAYRVSTVNKVMTHSALPVPDACYGQEVVNAKSIFASGETFYTGAYYRDNITGQTAVHTIYKPDNSIWQTWTQDFTTTNDYSWKNYGFTLPSANANGNWKYEVAYNGQRVSTNFSVGTGTEPPAPNAPEVPLPLTLLSFTAGRNQEQVVLQWETEKEVNINRYELQRSIDGTAYEPISTIKAKNATSKQLYTYTDQSPFRSINYYRLKIIDQDGSARYSLVAKIDNRQGLLWMEVNPNPFHHQLAIKTGGEAGQLELKVTTITGQTVLSKIVTGIRGQTIYLPTGSIQPGVYILSIYEGNNRVHYKKIIKGQ
jgi:murein DD-endopeptidase MepM/ murein hydrolase activator NlpD